jgi:hypothetical protein
MTMLFAFNRVPNGGPRVCAYCREPLRNEALRIGERYFCNELCADACAMLPAPRDGDPLRRVPR